MREPAGSYQEFWFHYLRQHGRPATRWLHFLGTGIAIALLLAALAYAEPWFVAAAVVAGYAFAWIGHAVVEHNRPATFDHPLWSLLSDFRMFGLWLTGRLAAELDRARIGTE